MDSRNALRATSLSTSQLPPARREAVDGAQTAPAELHLRLPARLPSAEILRTELADWLRTIETAGGGTIFDLQLACSEVLTIMIGQPGERSALIVETDAAMADRTVTVTMREFGLCRQPSQAAGRLDQALGLSLIEAMTDTLDIQQHAAGRTFTLRRKS